MRRALGSVMGGVWLGVELFERAKGGRKARGLIFLGAFVAFDGVSGMIQKAAFFVVGAIEAPA